METQSLGNASFWECKFGDHGYVEQEAWEHCHATRGVQGMLWLAALGEGFRFPTASGSTVRNPHLNLEQALLLLHSLQIDVQKHPALWISKTALLAEFCPHLAVLLQES